MYYILFYSIIKKLLHWIHYFSFWLIQINIIIFRLIPFFMYGTFQLLLSMNRSENWRSVTRSKLPWDPGRSWRQDLESLIQSHDEDVSKIKAQPDYRNKMELETLALSLEDIDRITDILTAMGFKKKNDAVNLIFNP